uniref:MAM domain containing 4 n=1 Tax=Varanus komodoensis TaxID=61221 RepID=A0A8D2KRU4_VARKO
WRSPAAKEPALVLPLACLDGALVNRCRGPSASLCDFVCDCWDCSDENQCGYQKESVALGTAFACDFEGSACGWEDVSTSGYQWAPAQSSIARWGSEPPFDHTTGTDLGWYMSTSRQRVKPSATAQLRSPLLREAAATCEIRAWYHLSDPGRRWGADQPGLGAPIPARSACGLPTLASHGPPVSGKGVPFPSSDRLPIPIQQGSPPTTFPGPPVLAGEPAGAAATAGPRPAPAPAPALPPGMALGHRCLWLPSGALLVGREPSPPSPCTRGQFACSDGKQCLGAELVCNFEADCADGSDEQQCGRCAGEEGRPGPGALGAPCVGLPELRRRGGLPGAGWGRPPFPAGPALGMTFRTGPRGLLALAVADESLGTSRWLWHRRGNGSVAWAQAHVPLGARARPFQVGCSAGAERSGLGRFLSPPHPAGLSCNFERGWCGWFLEQNDGFAWEWRAGGGWAPDHTTGTGAFLSADPSAAGAHGLRARLVSAPQVADGNASCLVFWYRMDGPQIGTLALLVKQAGKAEQVLWTRTGSQGAVWHRGLATISLPPGQSYQVVFEALRDGFLGAMGLDDLSVRPRACGAQKHCSFEADDCGLVASRPQTWARQDGAGGRGPPTDHTRGTPAGHYMLVNTSAAALPSGQAALLRSQAFLPLPRPQCLSFWYHPSGSSPGSLQVSVEEGSLRREMLRVSSLPAEGWRYGSFTVRAEASASPLWASLLARGPQSAPRPQLLGSNPGTPLPGSCDFESGTCGWSKPHGDWYSWDWKQGATPAQSPSPEEDHTFGTTAGHYAYVDTAALGPGRNAPARLASEPLPPTSGSCLQFYHPSATLRVKLQSLQGERTVWSATGTQSRAWLNQTLVVSSLTEFQVRRPDPARSSSPLATGPLCHRPHEGAVYPREKPPEGRWGGCAVSGLQRRRPGLSWSRRWQNESGQRGARQGSGFYTSLRVLGARVGRCLAPGEGFTLRHSSRARERRGLAACPAWHWHLSENSSRKGALFRTWQEDYLPLRNMGRRNMGRRNPSRVPWETVCCTLKSSVKGHSLTKRLFTGVTLAATRPTAARPGAAQGLDSLLCGRRCPCWCVGIPFPQEGAFPSPHRLLGKAVP